MLDREQLDFVDIATRPETHLGLVRLAAERRVPVICQKPMASKWAEAVAMVEAAAATSHAFHDPRKLALAAVVSHRSRAHRARRHRPAGFVRTADA